MELPEVGPVYMGGAVGMLYTLGEMGGFAAPVLIGYMRDFTGSFLVGIDSLILVVEAMVPVAFLLRERHSSD
jgi:nitrate/nitrite transporter NarK